MSTYTKYTFSSSGSGRGIKVVASGSPGTTIHTVSSAATNYDEIYLYAYNGHTANVILTIGLGGSTVPDDNIVITVPFKQGLYLIVPGLIIQGNASPVSVTAYANVANVISITGWVNRISA